MLNLKKNKPNINNDPNCTHTEGSMHDCSYVNLRNSFIYDAVKITHENVNRKTHPSSWDQFFMKTMNRMVAKALYK
jgi:hypothetical protein